MITAEAMRDYHRRLALYCLAAAGACTAGELVEQMGTAALEAGHPEQCWRGLTAPMLAGLMRELDGQAVVARRENRHNPRHGRLEAVWGLRSSDESSVRALPAPPASSSIAVGTAPGATPTAAVPDLAPRPTGLSRKQKLGLLQIEFQEMQARMLAEWHAFEARAARVLELEGEGA